MSEIRIVKINSVIFVDDNGKVKTIKKPFKLLAREEEI